MTDAGTVTADPVMETVTPVDVAIVGAGPAGLAAAVTCARAGLRVCLIDRGASLGGQYWRQPAASPDFLQSLVAREAPVSGPGRGPVHPRDLRHLHHDLATFEALRERVGEALHAGLVDLRLRTQVWTAVVTDAAFVTDAPGGTDAPGPAADGAAVVDLHVLGPAGVAGVVRARRLVIATGAHDIGLPFPGWDLPGVMTIGGIQALLKSSDVVPGRRVALGGTGPFLLPVATGLAARGVEVVGVFEANAPTGWWPHVSTVVRHPDRLREGLAYAATLARHRVPFRPCTMMVEAHGHDRVEAVSVCRLDRAGRPGLGSVVRHDVDAVGIGWGFSPILDLAVTLGCATRLGDNGFAVVAVDSEQRSSVPTVLVAGEPTGVGGAALALAEGELAGHVVVEDLTDPVGTTARSRRTGQRLRTVRRDVVRLRSFATAMHAAHPIPPGWAAAVRPETTVCRCEEVDAATVLEAVAAGADTARQVKQLTRAGMGWCQGRTCEPACALLAAGAAQQTTREKAPAAGPVGASALAGDSERLVAQPVSLGALADLVPRSSSQPSHDQ